MILHRRLALALIIALVCGVEMLGPPAPVAAPLQTCTAQNIRGFPISGVVCGGSTHALACTPGALYRCRSGPLGQRNNCTLSQAYAVGCLTEPTTGTLSDGCFAGSPPLTLSTSNTPGGNDVDLTVELVASHPHDAIINLAVDRGDLVPGSYCAVPDLAAGATSVRFALPTAVVSAPTAVHLYADIAYTDASGASRQLVTVPTTLTLTPGGTEPLPPPLAAVTLTPSTLGPGQSAFMDVVLARMAPARGVDISVSSSTPSVASVIPQGQPTVLGGCTTGGGAATVVAASAVPQQTTVTISTLTTPLMVTPGCAPTTCLEAGAGASGGACGTLPDGCGGTILCGCNFGGQICGGDGVPGVCGTPPILAVSTLALSPSTVTGGSAALGTVTLTMVAPPGGVAAFLASSSTAVSVPQSVVVPQGQTSASFTVITSAVKASTLSTICATLAGTVTAVLTVNPVISAGH
jgi:hypothetical protein